MPKTIKWESIEIGYQSSADKPDICDKEDDKPPDQKKLEQMFLREDLKALADGGTDELDVTDEIYDNTNDWAALLIEKKINEFLAKAGQSSRIKVDKVKDFCRMNHPDGRKPAKPKKASKRKPAIKSIDTRCVLRGDKWINVRTYRISASDGEAPWQPTEPTSEPYLTATLTWPCFEVRYALQRPITSTTKRSRGKPTEPQPAAPKQQSRKPKTR